ncbi:MAG TPA: T9SS type A sorting domain-containing protein [Bacteroidia bacterium]
MKTKLLFLFFFLMCHLSQAQHYATYKEMSSQFSSTLASAETGNDYTRHTSSYPFVFVLHQFSGYEKVFEVWDGSNWTALNKISIVGSTVDLTKWGDRILCSGRIASFNGNAAPIGKYFGFLEYKNGIWDTLPGCTFDSSFYFGNVCATVQNLYICQFVTGKPFVDGGSILSYNDKTSKFNKVVSIEAAWASNFQIVTGKHRLLMTDINMANDQSCIGFAYLDDNDTLIRNTDTAFKKYLFYGIDGTNDHIHAVQVDNFELLEFSDHLIRSRQVKPVGIPKNQPSSSSKFIQVWRGNVIWQWNDYVSSWWFNVLCPGDSVWTSIVKNNIMGTVWSPPMVCKYGVYVRDHKQNKMLELTTGLGARIDGSAFLDLDSNCNFNNKEKALRNYPITIKSSTNQSTVNTGKNGQYEFFVDKGTYQLSAPGMISNCSIPSFNITKTDTSFTRKLPIKGPNHYDYKVELLGASRVRWNSRVIIDAYIENSGYPVDSASIDFKTDPRLTIDSCSIAGIYYSGFTANGKIYDLDHRERRSIRFYAQMDTSVIKPDTVICSTFKSYINFPEKDSSDNNVKLCREVLYSFDPNHKECNAETILPTKSTKLEYYIGFQNEGKDDAYDIVLVDTLSTSLVPETFAIIGYSHPATVSLSGRVLTVTFKNIMLKPKSQDEKGSQGFFTFSIYTKGTLKQGEQVNNTAYIYFDLNKPVVTNTSIVQVKSNNSDITSLMNASRVMLYPNPSSGIFFMHCDEALASEYDVVVYNHTGQVVYSKNSIINDQDNILDLTSCCNGLYVVKICAAGEMYFVKVLIE